MPEEEIVDDKEKLFEELDKESSTLLKKGVSLSEFWDFKEKYHLNLSVSYSDKYGLILHLSLEESYWQKKVRPITIFAAPSARGALSKVSDLEEAVKFIRESKERVVLKLFERRDGQGICFRYYLQKVKK